MKKAKELYPDIEDEWVSNPSNYQPIIDEICPNIILQLDDEGYQGDTRVLFKKYELGKYSYGYLKFGWGSCSGCDALQSCDTVAEVDELIQELKTRIQYFESPADALKFFREHDWEGDYGWTQLEEKQFVAMCIVYFEIAVRAND